MLDPRPDFGATLYLPFTLYFTETCLSLLRKLALGWKAVPGRVSIGRGPEVLARVLGEMPENLWLWQGLRAMAFSPNDIEIDYILTPHMAEPIYMD